MILRRLIVLMALWPGIAFAQNFPALFDVTGIADEDVLNIRLYSDPQAYILDSFPPDQTGIEVIALDISGDWGQINLDEGTGWVAMTFLTRVDQPTWEGGQTPLHCFGTEPFWSLSLDPSAKTASYQLLGTEPEIGTITQFLIPAPGYLAELQVRFGDFVLRDASFEGKFCSDGMSDRLYGIRIDLTEHHEDPEQAPYQVQGCCSLLP